MPYNLKLIGYPIKHSMSPWIHKEFLKRTGIEGSYSLFEINPEDDFEAKLLQLKKEQTDGFNITVPYKEKIISYLDEIDETAREMQAVNTVVAKNGKWIGYNTDGIGYVRALTSAYPRLFQMTDLKILIIGSGGAARGIYYALARSGSKIIDLANRTRSKAEEIAALGTDKVNTEIYSISEAEGVLASYDLIIQTTSVGMMPNEEQAPLTIRELKEDAVVSDIIYQPIKTKLLQQAEQVNGNIHFGHTMLLYQAQSAFEIWTGKLANVTDMDTQLQQILEGR